MLLRIAGIAIETTDPSMKPSAEARIAATRTKRRCGLGQNVSSETGLFCGTALRWDSQGDRMPVEIGLIPRRATTGRDADDYTASAIRRTPPGRPASPAWRVPARPSW